MSKLVFDPIEFFSPHTVGGKEKSGTHSSACVYDDGQVASMTCIGCMAGIGSWNGGQYYRYTPSGRTEKYQKTPKEVYSSLWLHRWDDLPEYEAYWTFVLGPNSPWGEITKGAEIIRVDGKPIAYKLTNMEVPFAVLANLMFAVRMPYAQSAFLRMFSRMRAEGFTDHEALFITANIGLTASGKIVLGYVGDYPFDTNWYDMHWPHFRDGTPQAKGRNLFTQPGHYSPCNSIWSKDGKRPEVSNYTTTMRKGTFIQQLVTSKGKVTSKFASAFSTHSSDRPNEPVSIEEAIQILKDKKHEWQAHEGYSSGRQ